MKRISVQVGDRFTSKQGDVCTVVAYNGWDKVSIRFDDEHQHELVTRTCHLRSGSFKNPYHPRYYGVGYIGIGRFGTGTLIHKTWEGMLARCYKDDRSIKNESYADCSVEKTWFNFQSFAEWYVSQPFNGKGYRLDKDILKRGNKTYSSKNCCLVPQEINALFIDSEKTRGRYPIGVSYRKTAKCFIASISMNGKPKVVGKFDNPEDAHIAYVKQKEAYVKAMANKWKTSIDKKVYDALMAWEVE